MFLDEAGQATEPESLIPLGLVFEKTGQVGHEFCILNKNNQKKKSLKVT